MKKIVALLICALLIAALAIPAFAADDAGFVITADKTTVAPGETITLTVEIVGGEGSIVAFLPKFDSNVFELAGVTYKRTYNDYAYFGAPDKKTGNIAAFLDFDEETDGDQAAPIAGVLGTIKLKVKEGAGCATSVTGIGAVTSDGVQTNYSSNTLTIKMTGNHTYGQWAANGENHSRTCTGCGHVETESHGFGAWEPQDPYMNHVHSCSKCGHQEVAEHMWTLGELIKEPTCSEPGIQAAHCDVCGCDSQVTLPNDPSKHSWKAGEITTEPK